jgi:hypothetical protein
LELLTDISAQVCSALVSGVEGRANKLLVPEGDRKGVQVLDAKDMADEPVVVEEGRNEEIQVTQTIDNHVCNADSLQMMQHHTPCCTVFVLYCICAVLLLVNLQPTAY